MNMLKLALFSWTFVWYMEKSIAMTTELPDSEYSADYDARCPHIAPPEGTYVLDEDGSYSSVLEISCYDSLQAWTLHCEDGQWYNPYEGYGECTGIHGWMDGWVDGWMVGWMVAWWMGGWMGEWILGVWWVGRWVGGQMGGWMDGWMDGWLVGCLD